MPKSGLYFSTMKADEFASIKLPRDLVARLKQEAAKHRIPMYALVQKLIKKRKPARAATLPAFLRRFFWEVDAKQVSVRKNRGYVVQRLVSVGDQTAIDWLRAEVGDASIRKEIIACRGRGFTAAQVSPWISGPQHAAWNAEDSNRTLWVPE
jgi:hypothetical protein